MASSAIPSSSATTPKRVGKRAASPSRSRATSPLSRVTAIRAAAEGDNRSAMAKTSTPPSASASRPFSATGLPLRKVAVRSSPPIRRSSDTPAGTRRIGSSVGKRRRNSSIQAARTGPAGARSTTPPRPQGSTAKSAATNPATYQVWAPTVESSAEGPSPELDAARPGRPDSGMPKSGRIASGSEDLPQGTIHPDARTGLVQRVAAQAVA